MAKVVVAALALMIVLVRSAFERTRFDWICEDEINKVEAARASDAVILLPR